MDKNKNGSEKPSAEKKKAANKRRTAFSVQTEIENIHETPIRQLSKRQLTSARRSGGVWFAFMEDGELVGHFCLEGKQAKATELLIAAGVDGLTQLDTIPWLTRLAPIVHILRTKYHVEIDTHWEEHSDGRHARYVVASPLVAVTAVPEA